MEGLINIQEELKSKISNGFTNFKKSPKDRITTSYIETRLEQLEKQWSLFDNNHFQIISKIEKGIDLAYLNNNTYNIVEEMYMTYKVDLKESLNKFQVHTRQSTTDIGSQKEDSAVVKLPKIILPTFSGQYMEWQTFHDLFESLIHNNTSLAEVQKLHYLKGHLTGEAEQLLRHIPVTGVNYETCWLQLKKRYSNKRYIANCILKRLMSQKSLTSESSTNIKNMLDTTNDCLNALRNLGIDVSTWDIIIIYFISLKLDSETRKQWEQKISEYTDTFPTLEEFKMFLESKFRSLEFLEPNIKESKPKEKVTEKYRVFKTTTVSCPFCSESHLLHHCKKFCKESYGSRYDFVQKHRLCFNCFSSNHSVYHCKRSTKCSRCGRRHHSLIHPEGSVSTPLNAVYNPTESHQKKTDGQSSTCIEQVISNHFYSPGHVILATAVVKVVSHKGYCYLFKALLDQGSQASFVTEHCAQLLGLRKFSVKGEVSGLGGGKSHSIRHAVKFNIQSTTRTSFKCDVQAYVLKHLSSNLPVRKVAVHDWPELSKLKLADPEFATPSKIDILLGAEIYAQILKTGVLKNPSSKLVAQDTELGWILSGQEECKEDKDTRHIISLHVQDDTLNKLLRSFWEIESDQHCKILSEDEQNCESYFKSTTTRDSDGRYVVSLPFRDEDPQCQYGGLRDIALRRYIYLENRLKSPLLHRRREEYTMAMNDYLKQGHMKIISDPEDIAMKNCVYLPHHAVVREDKNTSRVRVVFDASCKGRNGRSLNDDLLIGPRLQSELRHILLKWRTYPVCFTADIIQMYRQVKVGGKDASKYQRLFWRLHEDEEIKEFIMCRVTFGVSSAPYLAVKSLQQLAIDEGKNFELGASKILNDFYMDDFMSGCENESQAVEIYKQVTQLLAKGGFILQKWASNSNKVMKMARGDRSDKNLDLKQDNIVKILGLCWDVSSDTFKYKVNLPEQKQTITKRSILSDIARLFDPLGWTAPVIVKAKIYLQKLWLTGLSWDEEITGELLQSWITFREDLPALNQVVVPRWIHTSENVNEVTIHGFCDVSDDAYSAVVYSRIVDSYGDIHINLLVARTKVAPIKRLSTPRLELCGAELLSNLLLEIITVMGFTKSQIRAWTDSTIVLAWLKGEPSRWKTFVANRVTNILKVLDNGQWSHVESAQNPADCASRGLNPSELLKNDMWFYGPDWLYKSRYLQTESIIPQTNIEERKVRVHTIINDDRMYTELAVWTKFSCLKKLVRVIAWCRRLLPKVRQNLKGISEYLTANELDESLKLCLRHCQYAAFSVDIDSLVKSGIISNRSRLNSLCPFMDTDGIMRVRGRIQQSEEEYDIKHPIILPGYHHISRLIVAEAHDITLHGGLQLMLNYIKSKYWIFNVKNMIKQYVRTCCKCVKYRAATRQPFMGVLPKARVTMSRPFIRCGIDYAGPINIRVSKGRGSRSYKGYICLFICMSTRAIHLEVVSDLTTEGFLSAFKRFVARRGHCLEVFSDNGTNFIGASKELQKLIKAENSNLSEEVAACLANNGTKWSFIPPHSPNFGGLWEAGVRSTKFHLYRVLNGTILTYEELSTVLAQIEACLNSRPLYQIPSDHGEPMPLTPGHFLVGEALLTVPDYNYEDTNISSLRRWQYTQKLVQHFWRKWSREYFCTLYQRYKWNKITPEPNQGDVVLVKEDGLPPSKWLLGVIEQKHPGPDQITRIVTIRCKNSRIKRPVSKLCILPISS